MKIKTTMKKFILSIVSISLVSAGAFSQEEKTNAEQPIQKVQVKVVKANKVEKAQKLNATHVKSTKVEAVSRKKVVKKEAKKED